MSNSLFGDEEYKDDKEEIEEEPGERDDNDYDVYATWYHKKDDGSSSEMCIDSVELPEEATHIDMPKELEINGFTYRLEE
jgi:hypothetical protein